MISYNDFICFCLNDNIPVIVKIAFILKYYKGCKI